MAPLIEMTGSNGSWSKTLELNLKTIATTELSFIYNTLASKVK